MNDNKYAVYENWSIMTPDSDECIIYPADKTAEEYDGFNVIHGAGHAGQSIDVYDSLEEAIVKSGWKPEYITFEDIPDKSQIAEILSRYVWDDYKGLISKE